MEHFLMKRILLVEDDERLANLVKNFLAQHAFDVTVLSSGEGAAETIVQEIPDLVLLDIMLPEQDGFSICRKVREQYLGPILFLTAKDSPIDHVMGLEMGAEDYIIKPVDPHVLLARINSVLRRRQPTQLNSEDVLSFGQLKVDKRGRVANWKGIEVELTSHEFELLWILSQKAGEPISRDEIHQAMIGRAYDGLDRTVDVRVSKLRKKLEDNLEQPFRIKTIWGKGYMLCPDAWE
jgi:DNA-binding response OmpR family regulator